MLAYFRSIVCRPSPSHSLTTEYHYRSSVETFLFWLKSDSSVFDFMGTPRASRKVITITKARLTRKLDRCIVFDLGFVRKTTGNPTGCRFLKNANYQKVNHICKTVLKREYGLYTATLTHPNPNPNPNPP